MKDDNCLQVEHPKALSKFDGHDEDSDENQESQDERSKRSAGCIAPESGTVELMDTWAFGHIDGKVLTEVEIVGGRYDLHWQGDRLMKLRPKLKAYAECGKYNAVEEVQDLSGDENVQNVDITFRNRD